MCEYYGWLLIARGNDCIVVTRALCAARFPPPLLLFSSLPLSFLKETRVAVRWGHSFIVASHRTIAGEIGVIGVIAEIAEIADCRLTAN